MSSSPAISLQFPDGFPPLVELMPHRPPMLLIDRVLSYSSEVATCEVQIRADALFVEDGQVPAVIGLEYMAQSVAAVAGLTARAEGKAARIGLLLGSRELLFWTDGFNVGETLVIEVRKTWGESELGSFACKIERGRHGGELLASGTLTVYQGPLPDRLQR